MKVNVKKLHSDAKMPERATDGSDWYDVFVCERQRLWVTHTEVVRTGLAFEIPSGYCLEVYGRSSSFNQGIVIHPGKLDSDYRGELLILAHHRNSIWTFVEPGQRIAHVALRKMEDTTFIKVEELSETKRGAGGLGSTGR